jgi:hypothetical protein
MAEAGGWLGVGSLTECHQAVIYSPVGLQEAASYSRKTSAFRLAPTPCPTGT